MTVRRARPRESWAATAECGVMTTGQLASRTSAPDTLPTIARRSGP